MEENTPIRSHALVTGGSRGIGHAIACTLATAGYDVAITGRHTAQLTQAVAAIEALGAHSYAITADLERPEAPAQVVHQAVSAMGGIDLLVNCAGLSLSGGFEEASVEDWNRIFAVNARAPFFICREALPYLKQSSRPIVINVASVVGFKGYVHQSVYASSKHALTGFTKVFAKEVQPFGIRVHLISPGGVATEMVTRMRPDIDTSELIQPDEIAGIVRYILSCHGNGTVDQFYIRRFSGLPFD